MSSVSAEAALLAIGLLNFSDDEGYFKADKKIVQADVFPLRELSGSVTELLQELSGIGYLRLFLGSDKRCYGVINNFLDHQKINKPTPSKIKGLELPEDSGSPTEPFRTGKERKGREGKGENPPSHRSEIKPIGGRGADFSVDADGVVIETTGEDNDGF